MFAGKTKREKLKLGIQLFLDAESRDRKWQSMAREDFAFRDGHQWTSEERRILEEELRPILTMNLTKSSVDLVMGMNEDTKVQFRCSPAEPTDGFLAEVLNDIIDWAAEKWDFEMEEDGALESATISGRGFVGIDFMPDPERFGEVMLQEINIPVHEIHFDPAARRHKLEDASYIVWDRWLTRHDFQMRWPKVSNKALDELINNAGSLQNISGLGTGDEAQHMFESLADSEYLDDNDYTKPLDFEWFDRSNNMVRVCHMEYWEMYKRYFVYNPEAGVFEEAPEKPTKEVRDKFLEEFEEEMVVEEMTDKKVKWLIFSGDRVLFDDDSPLPYKGFSIVPVFAFRDMSQRTANHFGIVRLMKDPQKEVNKRWSQALNMLNQQVQTGIYAEMDAFVDKRDAEASLKEPGSITWVNPGAITGGKIKERTVPAMPNAPMQMEQFSQDIIKKITGINPDLLGQDSGRQEPGVVVRMRQQQGIMLLKPLFRNFNQSRKELFKRQLAIVMEYMPDEQILRILGQNERYKIDENGMITDTVTEQTADLRDVRSLEYNIVAEQSPNNLSRRMYELQALMEMSQQFPVPPEQIIEKMDLPESEKVRWLEYIAQQQEAEAKQGEAMMAAQMELENAKLDTQKEKNIMDFLADIGKLSQMTEKDNKKMQDSVSRLSLEEQKAAIEAVKMMMEMLEKSEGEEDNGTEQPKQQQAPTP